LVNIRFAAKSGLSTAVAECPICAKRRHNANTINPIPNQREKTPANEDAVRAARRGAQLAQGARHVRPSSFALLLFFSLRTPV
jgi:hypothetical protein